MRKYIGWIMAVMMVFSIFFTPISVLANNGSEANKENSETTKSLELQRDKALKSNEEKAESPDGKSDKQIDKQDVSEEKTKAKASEEQQSAQSQEIQELNKANGGILKQNPISTKNFTLTKKSAGTETKIGDFDKFIDTISAMDINDPISLYTVYVNKNTTIPSNEGSHYRSNNKIRITSGQGGPYTLKREGEKNFIAIQTNSELTVDNVILDGSNKSECLFISNNGKVTIGKGAILQNFADTEKFDGPAILLSSGNPIINIEAGSIIRNNTSEQQGGFIQARRGSTVNVNGGSFINNKTTKSDGGVIAAYGNLNVNGGIFQGNKASEKKTAGAIFVGSAANATIKNTTFKDNKASTGGAIYSLNTISISNTTFENNKANWGGSVFAYKPIDLKDVKFIGNNSEKQAGALYLSSDANITSSEFKGNSSAGGGGAIFVANNSKGTVKISNSSFLSNSSLNFGGGIYLGINSKLEVKGSKFAKNGAAFGGGISSAGGSNFDSSLTGISLNDVGFEDNESLLGGGLFTAFPTDITDCDFAKNIANVHPQDKQENPHKSGVGGAIYVMDSKTIINNSIFKENNAYGSGGAIGINGVVRDKNSGEITAKKPNIKVEISNKNEFRSNVCKVGQGGAIYTIPYEYNDPITDTDAYKNLSIDNTTLFMGNKSLSGKFNPPTNFEDFTNLEFSEASDVLHGTLKRKSLLNNYDVNYKNPNVLVTFVNDGKNHATVKVEAGKTIDNDGLTEEIMPQEPSKKGYSFKEWNTQKDGKGTKFTGDTVVKQDITVYAIYTKNDDPASKPDGKKPQEKPSKGPSNSPKTGDDINLYIYIALIALSGVFLGITGIKKKKYKN